MIFMKTEKFAMHATVCTHLRATLNSATAKESFNTAHFKQILCTRLPDPMAQESLKALRPE